MPRLLLVDDNPSIHRIAESLLAHTDVVLVCAGSAPEALDLLSHGERFDLAMVDTSMPGMDGWSLVERLRALPETARMPIALMAGVLDPIDPNRLARAPIQGFLKKPIELRELAERVLALAATPVEEPVAPTPGAAEDDLLVLVEEDLWPEAAVPVPEVVPEVVLDLEELDLESLEGDLLAEPAPVAELEPAPEEPAVELEDLDLEVLEGDLAEAAHVDPAPEPESQPEELAIGPEDLDFEVLEGDLAEPAAGTPEPEPEVVEAPEPEPEVVEAPESEPEALEAPAPEPVEASAAEPEALVATEPEHIPAEPEPHDAPGLVAAPQSQPAPPEEAARVLVQAVLADPELLEALARAVVARLGDGALREIAWEIMPDLARRLQK